MQLQVQNRENGSNVARALRRDDMIPGVIFGGNKDSLSIAMKSYDLMMAMQSGKFFGHLVTLKTEKGKETVLPREMQYHPVNGKVLHVDLQRVDPKREITLDVHVEVSGEDEAPGIEEGGILQVLRHTISITCRADSIPEAINISVAGFNIGDSIHLEDIKLPEGVEHASQDLGLTVASIVSTRSAVEDEEAEEGEEGEELEAAAEGEEAAEGEGESAEASEGEETSKEAKE